MNLAILLLAIVLVLVLAVGGTILIRELRVVAELPAPTFDTEELAELVDVVDQLVTNFAEVAAHATKDPAPTLLDRRTRQRVVVSVIGEPDLSYSGALWEWDATGVILRGAEAHTGGGTGVPIDGELYLAAHRINVITIAGAS